MSGVERTGVNKVMPVRVFVGRPPVEEEEVVVVDMVPTCVKYV